MFKRTLPAAKAKVCAHTLISHDTEVTGNIHFKGELIIEGTLKGTVTADPGSNAVLRIAETGFVDGNIHVPIAIINGGVKGEVRSDKQVELGAKASVDGNIHYCLIEMVLGAQVSGSLTATEAKFAASAPLTALAQEKERSALAGPASPENSDQNFMRLHNS